MSSYLEIILLFATLAAIGPLVRPMAVVTNQPQTTGFGLAEFPG
jgi:MFS transporter, BCD family, chlorophyll transporter